MCWLVGGIDIEIKNVELRMKSSASNNKIFNRQRLKHIAVFLSMAANIFTIIYLISDGLKWYSDRISYQKEELKHMGNVAYPPEVDFTIDRTEKFYILLAISLIVGLLGLFKIYRGHLLGYKLFFFHKIFFLLLFVLLYYEDHGYEVYGYILELIVFISVQIPAFLIIRDNYEKEIANS